MERNFLNAYKGYIKLVRLDKPIGILLLLWPTLWAIVLSSKGIPDGNILGIFILGVILMRSAGCIVNDIVDRQYDIKVARTANRVLSTNEVSLQEASVLLIGILLLAGSLLFSLNEKTILLALGALFFTVIYPFFKRFFLFPQAILGIAFGFGILMAYSETKGSLEPMAWILFIGNFFWALSYDTVYALSDIEDDKKLGLRSSAITLGDKVILGICIFQGIFLFLMISPVAVMENGIIYGFFWFLSALYSYYLFKKLLDIEPNYQRIFLDNQRVGALLFLGFLIEYGV
ncbi:MAG: 4-hydroxybenzoate octaprenyltransferase [Proteobacteria bacterium]|jgi:4-hydroxybenzoate polyprenyltransferase|nr:4-hydroxybenzoate octaprenyltransferase [Pseudomonadota bacterium]